MKLDMHCHVKEGSIDSKVSLDEYITLLKERGFDGMLITDHDTYKGYRHWKYQMKGKVHDDFVVLKGIEYDTCDGGHILCIMPEGVKMRLLELRGLPVAVLIDFVHKHGGILGPAHPCGGKYLSFTQSVITNHQSYLSGLTLLKYLMHVNQQSLMREPLSLHRNIRNRESVAVTHTDLIV